jgi:hypothetical protein
LIPDIGCVDASAVAAQLERSHSVDDVSDLARGSRWEKAGDHAPVWIELGETGLALHPTESTSGFGAFA